MITSAIGIIVLFALIIIEVPIASALFLVGFSGIWYLSGFKVANSVVHYAPLGAVLSGEVSTLPLFILLGALALSAGVATDGYKVARLWLGKLPGGLGVATIAASSAFASCSGSSLASAVTMGKISMPEMKANGYSNSLSAGVCGAGGLLASMIPPSGMMVIYGMASGVSVGKLLIAGVIPGLLVASLFVLGIIVKAKLDPSSAPVVKDTITWKERFQALPQAWGIVVIFGTIFVGLFSGIFTTNESAAFGAMAALILLVIKTRKGGFLKAFSKALTSSAEITVSIFFLVLGAYVFSNFLIIAGLPQAIAETVLGSGWPPIAILLGMIATYFVLGMFMDGVTIMLLTIPIYYPIVHQLGFSGIWFGVIVVAMVEIGLVSPPFGMVAYAIQTVEPDMDLVTIFKGCAMFLFLELAVVVLLLFFPQIATWLPSLMK